MEDVSFDQLVIALSAPSYRDFIETILQSLCNKVADDLDAISADDMKSAIEATWVLLMTKQSNEVIVNLVLSFFTNITISSSVCEIFLENSTPENLSTIINTFLDYNPQLEPTDVTSWESVDNWQHVASILCNMSTVENGREIILKRSSNYYLRLASQIRSRNPIRRRGSVGSLRSCLFDNEIHWWFIVEINALSYLLYPLIVATPFTEKEKHGMDPMLWMQAENVDKTHESEVDIVVMLLDCIILLCQRRGIRELLRKRKVYPICRNLDYIQEDESVNLKIYEIVNLLMGEEDPSTPMETPPLDQLTITNGTSPVDSSVFTPAVDVANVIDTDALNQID